MKRLYVAAAMAACTTLAACGGSATVDGEVATSIAPLERATSAPSSATAASATAASGTAASATAASATAARGTAASATAASATAASRTASESKDQPAKEISAIPEPVVPQQPFLEALRAAGINTDGVEDQLLGAGDAACNEADHVTVGAVAGQLIEQGRTTLPHDQVAALISDNARQMYCK